MGDCNPVTHILKVIEVLKRFGRDFNADPYRNEFAGTEYPKFLPTQFLLLNLPCWFKTSAFRY